MKKNKGSVLITVLLFVLVVLAIGGAYYFSKNSSNVLKDASDNLVKETQKQNEKVVADTEKNADIKKVEDSLNQDGKFLGYIKSVSNLNGNYSLKIDYIEWDSCTPAVGQPESCNNGYKIINNNPLIRTLPISNTATIETLSITGLLTSPTLTTLSSFKTFFDSTKFPWKNTIPFHVTIVNGIITEITEQYIP